MTTLPNCISCIIEYLIGSWQKSPPSLETNFNAGQDISQKLLKTDFHTPVNTFHTPLKSMLRLMIPKSFAEKLPPVAKQGQILRLDLSISCSFQELWFSWQKSLPLKTGQKSPPPFCLFVRDLACVTHVEYPWSPYYKSTLRFLLSKYLLWVINFVNFSKYSHIQNYRTQDHGSGGRPIGSLTTIHTNIPAITITVLDMELYNVIRLLYVYACISLSGYMTKLLVMHLKQVMSL